MNYEVVYYKRENNQEVIKRKYFYYWLTATCFAKFCKLKHMQTYMLPTNMKAMKRF